MKDSERRLPTVTNIPRVAMNLRPSWEPVSVGYCECAMCVIREAAAGFREFSPDQPRERGRFSKGAGKGAPAPSSDHAFGKRRPMSVGAGRAVFAAAGKRAGYKEKTK